MTSLFIVALSLAAAPVVPSGSADRGQPDQVVIAQLGSGDVTSPIGQTSANTTSGGMGGLDRSDALGGSQGSLAGGGSMNMGGAETSGATSSATAAGSTSATGTTTAPLSPSTSGSTSTGRSASGGLLGSGGSTGLGGTSTSTGLGSTTGGMR